MDEGVGLYRIEANEGPGARIRIVNFPVPGPFRESIKCGEQNLLVRAKELVGGRDPRQHEPVHNAISIAELAVEKGASTLLIPISARKQLNDLSDEMAMKLSILYYADMKEALLKALADGKTTKSEKPRRVYGARPRCR